MEKGRERQQLLEHTELCSAAAPAVPAQLCAPEHHVIAQVSWVVVQHCRTSEAVLLSWSTCQWDTRHELPSDCK